MNKENASEKVLLADDDIPIMLNIQEILEESGYNVVCSCSDGFSAIDGFRKHHPDIVLLDIRMPMLDGLSASQIILKESPDTVVLVLSAYSDIPLVEKAQKLGVAGYMVKPVSAAAIIPAIKMAQSKANELALLRKELEKSKKDLENRKLIEKAKGIIMEKDQMSEEQAFDYIRNISKEKHISMPDVATLIISSNEGT